MSQEAFPNHVKCTQLNYNAGHRLRGKKAESRNLRPIILVHLSALARIYKRVGLKRSFDIEPWAGKVQCTTMEKQTIYSIYKAVTDNRKASEDNNDEVTEEPKGKMKKKKKSTRKKISKLTREEEVESKLCW